MRVRLAVGTTALLIACEADPASPPARGTPIGTGPEVVASSPTDGAVGIARAATVAVVFSAPVDPATVHEGSVGLWRGPDPVPADLSLDGTVARLVPRSLLDLGTVYDLIVSREVHDTSGTALIRSFRAVFTTKMNRIPVPGSGG